MTISWKFRRVNGMNLNEQKFRILMLITSASFADEATDLFNDEDVPIHYRLVGAGTAPSEIMDSGDPLVLQVALEPHRNCVSGSG